MACSLAICDGPLAATLRKKEYDTADMGTILETGSCRMHYVTHTHTSHSFPPQFQHNVNTGVLQDNTVNVTEMLLKVKLHIADY